MPEKAHQRELTHNFQNSDGYEGDLSSTVRVYEKAKIPRPLRDSVESILIDTIGHLLDGREISWWIDDNDNYVLTLIGGYPDIPGFGAMPMTPSYQVKEKFLGLDGNPDGLLESLHGNWDFDEKNRQSLVFYPKR